MSDPHFVVANVCLTACSYHPWLHPVVCSSINTLFLESFADLSITTTEYILMLVT